MVGKTRQSISGEDTLTSDRKAKAPPVEENIGKEYKPTKIKICHPWSPLPGITEHPINKMFQNYNFFCRTLFVNKATYEQNYKLKLNQLIKAARSLGLYLQKGQLLPENLKTREGAQTLKEKIFGCFIRTIAQSN
jgi:hypothetical protein